MSHCNQDVDLLSLFKDVEVTLASIMSLVAGRWRLYLLPILGGKIERLQFIPFNVSHFLRSATRRVNGATNLFILLRFHFECKQLLVC